MTQFHLLVLPVHEKLHETQLFSYFVSIAGNITLFWLSRKIGTLVYGDIYLEH